MSVAAAVVVMWTYTAIVVEVPSNRSGPIGSTTRETPKDELN